MKRLVLMVALLLTAAPGFAAICTVTEHIGLFILPNGTVTPMPDIPIRTYAVTYTSSTASSNAWHNQTTYIGITCTALAHYLMGADPTADAGDTIIPAGEHLYIPVVAGQKIAFYDGTT